MKLFLGGQCPPWYDGLKKLMKFRLGKAKLKTVDLKDFMVKPGWHDRRNVIITRDRKSSLIIIGLGYRNRLQKSRQLNFAIFKSD